MAKAYTIEQIRKYLLAQDSMGDILYNLTEEKIDEANIPIDTTSDTYQKGIDDYQSGVPVSRNLCYKNTQEYKEWEAGWEYAQALDECS